MAMPAFAQADAAPVGTAIPDVPRSRPVVQPLPPQAATDLSEALRRLGSNGQDGDALLKAGWASLDLDNIDAAIGFFSRAEAVPSSAAEAKAGLGAVLVNRKRPVEAIQYFNDAEAAGAKLGAHAAQRGLAYDLVGDNAHAQQYYREALAVKPSDDVIRWLALSQAIGGDRNGSETTLLPLLQHSDLAAYRTRAFALAALGKTEEAVSIANAVMPMSLANRIAPYLRYMPKLTKAQQAAAGIFGHFPEADAIGHDDPRIAEYASGARPVAVASTALDARLTPSGKPLGEKPKPAAPPPSAVVTLAKADTAPVPSFSLKPSGARELPPTEPKTPEPKQEELKPITPKPVEAKPVEAKRVEAKPVEQKPVDTAPVERPRVADAFAGLGAARGAAVPAAGAVDITKIDPARDAPKPVEDAKDAKDAEAKDAADKKDAKTAREPKKEAKPKKPTNPSRIWVQLASGRDRDALAFDWRRFKRENAQLLGSRDPYLARYGRSSRLVTGPFASEKEANAFVAKLKKAGITPLVFTSDDGEAVDPLP